MFRYNTPLILRYLFPQLTWKIKVSEKVIYLTFDDGPHPQITPWVLQVLEKYQARATFFCVGDNARKFPQILQQVLAGGHRIGNHTHNHLNGWKSGNAVYLRNVAECDTYTHTPLFRPPYGKISPVQAYRLRKKNFDVVMWSILSRDYEKDLDIPGAAAAMEKHTTKGSIVLFHDSEKAEQNLRALLPGFLAFFAAKGFRFDALPYPAIGLQS